MPEWAREIESTEKLSTDYGNGIAVDASGAAYVTGSTDSTNFPTTVNAYQRSNAGDYDAFVAKLALARTVASVSLVYSTYLGGSGFDRANGIAVDTSGSAYVTGLTASNDFPTVNPFQGENAGGGDAFVAKLALAPTVPWAVRCHRPYVRSKVRHALLCLTLHVLANVTCLVLWALHGQPLLCQATGSRCIELHPIWDWRFAVSEKHDGRSAGRGEGEEARRMLWWWLLRRFLRPKVCESCSGRGHFQESRGRWTREVCNTCNGTGAKPGTGRVASRLIRMGAARERVRYRGRG